MTHHILTLLGRVLSVAEIAVLSIASGESTGLRAGEGLTLLSEFMIRKHSAQTEHRFRKRGKKHLGKLLRI